MKFVGADQEIVVGAALAIDYAKWATNRNTPLWLTFYSGKAWNATKSIGEIWENLLPLRQSEPPESLWIHKRPAIPIELPLGLEEDAVLAAIIQRLEYIADMISTR